jgi:hypothetical protein
MSESNFTADIEQVYDHAGLLPVPQDLGRTLSKNTVTLVQQYPSPGNKALNESGIPYAMYYPGQRPETSFSLVGDNVNAIAASAGDEKLFYINAVTETGEELIYNLDDVLTSMEAAPMGKRYPVIAFGSNANPGQLAQKFKDLEGADREVVPTMIATIKGVVPVYSGRIGINGYVFTDLFPAAQDVESRVHINFLSEAQLRAMDATEKAYSLCKIEDVRLQTHEAEGYSTDAYLYVGREDEQGANILIDGEGHPIRLSEITTTGDGLDSKFSSMTQAEAQQYIFEVAGRDIASNLRLYEQPIDEVDLVKLIIDRKDDLRLEALREYIAKSEKPQPLGRVVGQKIQAAIEGNRITTKASGLRKIIPKQSQDVSLEDAQTFGELQK